MQVPYVVNGDLWVGLHSTEHRGLFSTPDTLLHPIDGTGSGSHNTRAPFMIENWYLSYRRQGSSPKLGWHLETLLVSTPMVPTLLVSTLLVPTLLVPTLLVPTLLVSTPGANTAANTAGVNTAGANTKVPTLLDQPRCLYTLRRGLPGTSQPGDLLYIYIAPTHLVFTS